MNYRFAWILLAVAILAGTALRVSGVESRSLWGDEIISLAFATGHSYYPWHEDITAVYDADHYRSSLSLDRDYFSQRLVDLLRTETQAPFYYFLLNFWLHLFGKSEAALRSLSLLASIASIPLLYLLGRRLLSVETGAYSALIFSAAPFQIAYAIYNRPYALLGFFALLSTYVVVRFCQGENRLRWIIVYIISAICGIYTHYYYVWVLLFHWMLVVFSQRRNRKLLRRWLLIHVVVGMALTPWIPVFYEQVQWNKGREALTWAYWFSGVLSLPDMIVYTGRNILLLLSLGRINGLCSAFHIDGTCRLDFFLTGFFYIIPVLVLCLCILYFVRYLRSASWKNKKSPDPWGTCLLWCLVLFGGPLIIDIVKDTHSMKLHRYFIAASGPLYMIVAITISSIPNRRLQVLMTSGLLVFLFAGSVLYIQGFSGTHLYVPDVRKVAFHIDQHEKQNDLVIVLNPGQDPMDLAYYLKSNPNFARVIFKGKNQSAPDIRDQLQKISSGRKRIWYLDDLGPEIQARSKTLEWLRNHYEEKEMREFTNLGLFLFVTD